MWLDKLREMKELSGLTTKEISARSGIPEPTLEKIFAGATKDPKLETMRQLVHFFGFTLDDLEATTEIIKKFPATNDTVSGEAVMDIFNYLNEGLISLGIIREDEDITKEQADILISIARIIRATFDKE